MAEKRNHRLLIILSPFPFKEFGQMVALSTEKKTNEGNEKENRGGFAQQYIIPEVSETRAFSVLKQERALYVAVRSGP